MSWLKGVMERRGEGRKEADRLLREKKHECARGVLTAILKLVLCLTVAASLFAGECQLYCAR